MIMRHPLANVPGLVVKCDQELFCSATCSPPPPLPSYLWFVFVCSLIRPPPPSPLCSLQAPTPCQSVHTSFSLNFLDLV